MENQIFTLITTEINNDNFETAIILLNKVIKENANIPISYVYKANCYMQLKKYQKAKKNYLKALNLGYKDAKIYYNLGLIARFNEQYFTALKYFTLSLDLKPNYVFPLVNRGAVQMILGNYQLGLNDFCIANKVVKKDPLIFINKALVY